MTATSRHGCVSCSERYIGVYDEGKGCATAFSLGAGAKSGVLGGVCRVWCKTRGIPPPRFIQNAVCTQTTAVCKLNAGIPKIRRSYAVYKLNTGVRAIANTVHSYSKHTRTIIPGTALWQHYYYYRVASHVPHDISCGRNLEWKSTSI